MNKIRTTEQMSRLFIELGLPKKQLGNHLGQMMKGRKACTSRTNVHTPSHRTWLATVPLDSVVRLLREANSKAEEGYRVPCGFKWR